MKPIMIQLWFPPAPAGALGLSKMMLWEEIVFCEDLFDAVAKALAGCRTQIELPDITSIGIENHLLSGYAGFWEEKPLFTVEYIDLLSSPFEFWVVYQRHQQELAQQLLFWAESRIEDAIQAVNAVDQIAAEGGPDYRPLVSDVRRLLQARREQAGLDGVIDSGKRKPTSKQL